MTFGEWLMNQLAAAEMERADFVRSVGVGSSAVTKWVNGQSVPSPRVILDIARVLRLPPDTVLYAVVGQGVATTEAIAALRLPPNLTVGEARLVSQLAWGVRRWRDEEDDQRVRAVE